MALANWTNAVLALWMAAVALYYLNLRLKSPRLALLNRWLAWGTFSIVAAYFFVANEWVERPFGLMVFTFAVLWFLVETGFSWWTIRMVNRSGCAVFPLFKPCSRDLPWPNTKRFLAIKSWLNGAGFKEIGLLEATVVEGIRLPSWVFENEDKTVRFQMILLPRRRGLEAGVSFFSQDNSGRRFVTNNLFTPYGGFYPSYWSLRRRPFCRDLEKLYKVHERHVRRAHLKAFELSAQEDLAEQQTALDKTNVEMGFVNSRGLRGDYGSLTRDGRYRLWKETWLLKYLGLFLRG